MIQSGIVHLGDNLERSFARGLEQLLKLIKWRRGEESVLRGGGEVSTIIEGSTAVETGRRTGVLTTSKASGRATRKA